MSDETPPPPLRLKPRQRSEDDAPEAPAQPLAAQPEDTGKLRLKPKLVIQAEPEPEPAPEPVEEAPVAAAEPAAEPEPEPQPVEEAAPPPPPLPEDTRGKLKIRLPGAAAQDAAPAPAEGEADPEAPPEIPAFPVVAPPPPDDEPGAPPVLPEELAKRSSAPFQGKLPPGASRPSIFIRPKVPAALLAAERRRRWWKYGLIAVGGVVLAVGVISLALKFTEPPPVVRAPPKARPAPPPVVVVPPPVAPKPVPVAVVEPPPVDANANVRVASTATVELAPGVLATTESIKAVPAASPAFRSWVANAKVSGVYQGIPPRAFINGRLVRVGESVDDALEIYFDSIDTPSRSLVFKDAQGATVSRRY